MVNSFYILKERGGGMKTHNEYLNLFDQLKQLIEKRKENEKGRNEDKDQSPLLPETDINFCDINGHSLLHYAILMGDKALVRELVEEKRANINLKTDVLVKRESPIDIALKLGHLEIAQYLFEKGADCRDVQLSNVSNLECRLWLSDQIKKALQESYSIKNVDGKRIFNQTNQFFNIDSINQFEPQMRAIEVGDLDYLQSDYQGFIEDRNKAAEAWPKFLNLAAANNQKTVLDFLYGFGIPIDPKKPYTQSAFQEAVRCHQFEMAKYLLSLGANINWQNNYKKTALMQAVEKNDQEAVLFLLSHNASMLPQDIYHNNVLHMAAMLKDPAFLEVLKNKAKSEKSSLLDDKNLFGKTPLELSSNSSDIPINQLILVRKLFYYLKSHYRDTSLLSLEGCCNGFTYLFLLYAAQERQCSFFEALEKIAKWDGKEIPKGDELGTFFERWLHKIIFFQNHTIRNLISIGQHERRRPH